MIDGEKRTERQEKREKIRQRMRVKIDPANYEYYEAKKPADFYDTEVPQSVGIYVRVSTDDLRQTTSYELQQKYYEDYVRSRPNWTLYRIYADEGISGTSLRHRDAFNQMISDAKAGKIDLIITKNVSRFARNVMITIGMVRELSELQPPVGVFFESEAIFSLNDDSQLGLTFVATLAEEESHTRSRSMETSLRMRLDNGIPLTPKLLGYTHDIDGNLIINHDEAPTVKLAFFMYLFGYSTKQIADAFNALGRRTYLGNQKWRSGSILQILRNERHCGEVLTRKTYTENYRTHRQLKNRGQRPQSRYLNHHEAIVSRDDFIAVQRMLDNAKFGNKTILPELRVVDSGVFKGFAVINPRWAGFRENEYYLASRSVYEPRDIEQLAASEYQVEVEAGEFDLRGFEIARTEFFDIGHRPAIKFQDNHITLSRECVQKFGENNCMEFLINPITRKFAIRPTDKMNRCGVLISKLSEGRWIPKTISSAAYSDTLYSLFGWKKGCSYRIIGSFLEQSGEIAYVFDIENSEAFLGRHIVKSNLADSEEDSVAVQILTPYCGKVRAIPEEWTTSFGKEYYLHEQPLAVLESQNEAEWNLWLQGRLFETGKRLKVTPYEELRQYISQALSVLKPA